MTKEQFLSLIEKLANVNIIEVKEKPKNSIYLGSFSYKIQK